MRYGIKSSGPAIPRRFIPRGGPFSVVVPERARDAVSVESAVRQVVAEYHVSGYPGEYEVVVRKDTLHVVPVVSLGAASKRALRRSLFDREVDIAPGRYAGIVLVHLVLDQLNAQQEFPIGLAVVSTSTFDTTVVDLEGGRYVARDLFLRINAAALQPVSWWLLFEPVGRRYYLNVGGIASDPYAERSGR